MRKAAVPQSNSDPGLQTDILNGSTHAEMRSASAASNGLSRRDHITQPIRMESRLLKNTPGEGTGAYKHRELLGIL